MIFVCYSPTGQLDAYIKNLERVLDAIEFFNQNNPSCVELTNLVCVAFYFIYWELKYLLVCLSVGN